MAGVFLLFLGRIAAQAPVDRAWTILQAGATNRSSEQRIATMRVLQRIPGDAKAASLSESGLEDEDSGVRGAAALSLGGMKSRSLIPKLAAALKQEKDGNVVMAIAKSLIQLGDARGTRSTMRSLRANASLAQA